MPALPRLVRFGTYELDTVAGEIRKDGRKIPLQEKPLQLLVVLLESAGDIVTREALQRALWPADTFVDFDHSLGAAVAKLRSALGDSARNPRFVETVGGRGYRFIAPLLSPAGAAPELGVATVAPALPVERRRALPLRRTLAAAIVGLLGGGALIATLLGLDVWGAREWLRRHTSPAVRAIAVLPLANLSTDPEQEYFADGMTEELITTLAQVPGVRVISRTSAMQFKGASPSVADLRRALGVDAVVQGSVVRADGRVRISARLVDARTEQHLWARSYERNASDTLDLQRAIAQAIAEEIRVRLTEGTDALRAHPHSRIPAAQEAYLRGRYQLNKGDEASIRRSVAEFKQAIAEDAADARSYAGLAGAYIALTDYYQPPTEMMPLARTAAQRAVDLDASLSEAHANLGAVRFLFEWDWAGAEAELKRAVDLEQGTTDARVWYGVFLAQMGRSEESLAQFRDAEAIDPLSVPVHVNAGWAYFVARRNAEAIAEWRKALDLEPTLATAHTSIWVAYAQQRRGASGLSARDPLGLPEAPVAGESGSTSPINLAAMAGVYAMSGKRADAEATLATLEALSARRYVCPYEIATAHAALGNRDQALLWLRKGIERRSICMPDARTDPRLDSLRGDPRFEDLLREVGFGR
jgi:TolB-like protein/DNA-binding winged helix-turn-helix (wHTH) protein